jgi:hypothetical protein
MPDSEIGRLALSVEILALGELGFINTKHNPTDLSDPECEYGHKCA